MAPEVKSLKQAAKRVLAKSPARKLPIITVDILLAIFKVLDFTYPLHVCMRAVFLVAFFSLLRKSNLVPTSLAEAASDSAYHLKRCHVYFQHDHCILRVHKTKIIQFHQRALEIVLPLIPNSVLCPVSALLHHLCLSILDPRAPLFTIAIPGGSRPITGPYFAKFLKSCMACIGLDPTQFSPHSFRRGGATFAFNSGASPLFITFLGDWSSDAYMVYLVLNTSQKLSLANTLAKHIPTTNL